MTDGESRNAKEAVYKHRDGHALQPAKKPAPPRAPRIPRPCPPPSPAAAATPGFQLSFGAVVGMLRIGPALMRFVPPDLPWPVRWLVEGTTTTVAATLGSLPAVGWWLSAGWWQGCVRSGESLGLLLCWVAWLG